jgi:ribosome-associated protein
LLERLELSDKFKDAIADAKRITNFEGKRRQMQYIGKLMRLLEPQVVETVRAALDEQANGSNADKLLLHQAETWRDRLVDDEDAAARWINLNPSADMQQLRALIRQARKDAKPEKPGAAVRHGRAYREIFLLVREQLTAIPDREPDAPVFNPAFDAS